MDNKFHIPEETNKQGMSPAELTIVSEQSSDYSTSSVDAELSADRKI